MSLLQTIDDYFCCTGKQEEMRRHGTTCFEFYEGKKAYDVISEWDSEQRRVFLFGKYIPNTITMTSMCVFPAGIILGEAIRLIANVYYHLAVKKIIANERETLLFAMKMEECRAENLGIGTLEKV